MTPDRELLAVLVALEPLDDRKWNYLDLSRRTFDADGLLEEPLSSGERVLVESAASLWNTGRVDLGYIACAMGGSHLQAVLDAIAVRAGHDVASHADLAVARIGGGSGRRHQADRTHDAGRASPSPGRLGERPGADRSGLER